MYRIRMLKNEDFSEKECFISRKIFKPGKVIVVLEKKRNGKFKTVGFINPSKIKECQAFVKNLDDESFNENSKASLFLQGCAIVAQDGVADAEKRISFLRSIMASLYDEMQEHEKCLAEQESVIDGINNTDFRFPTWKEYRVALKERGTK